jgi:chromosome segregation ATPase
VLEEKSVAEDVLNSKIESFANSESREQILIQNLHEMQAQKLELERTLANKEESFSAELQSWVSKYYKSEALNEAHSTALSEATAPLLRQNAALQHQVDLHKEMLENAKKDFSEKIRDKLFVISKLQLDIEKYDAVKSELSLQLQQKSTQINECKSEIQEITSKWKLADQKKLELLAIVDKQKIKIRELDNLCSQLQQGPSTSSSSGSASSSAFNSGFVSVSSTPSSKSNTHSNALLAGVSQLNLSSNNSANNNNSNTSSGNYSSGNHHRTFSFGSSNGSADVAGFDNQQHYQNQIAQFQTQFEAQGKELQKERERRMDCEIHIKRLQQEFNLLTQDLQSTRSPSSSSSLSSSSSSTADDASASDGASGSQLSGLGLQLGLGLASASSSSPTITNDIITVYSLLRQKEGEIDMLKRNQRTMKSANEDLAGDLASMRNHCANLESKLASFPSVMNELSNLKVRCAAAVDLLGEREDEMIELKENINEMKDAFRLQIEDLLRTIESLKKGQSK